MAKKKKEEDEIISNSDLDIIAALAEGAEDVTAGSGVLLDEDSVDADLTQFISTGSVILDTVISNRADKGGFPVGRISEVIGFESSGKSLLGIHACADTQRQGGIPIYYDIEKAMSLKFMQNMGVDVTRLSFTKKLTTIEEVLERIDKDVQTIIEKQLNKKAKNRRQITIVVDSLASCTTREMLEAEIGVRTYARMPMILSQHLPHIIGVLDDANVALIVLNQLREKPNVMFGDKWYAPGGNAMKFYASLRLLMQRGSKIKAHVGKPNESVIGYNTTVETKKNKVSAPARKAKFDIYFNRGIDDASGYLDILMKTGIVNRPSKTTQELILPSGEAKPFKLNDWKKLMEEYKPYVIDEVKKALIIDLDNPDLAETREEITDEPRYIDTDNDASNDFSE